MAEPDVPPGEIDEGDDPEDWSAYDAARHVLLIGLEVDQYIPVNGHKIRPIQGRQGWFGILKEGEEIDAFRLTPNWPKTVGQLAAGLRAVTKSDEEEEEPDESGLAETSRGFS